MKFSQITHRTPLGKKYWLNQSGELQKEILVSRGVADVKVLECQTLKELGTLIRGATAETYLVSGIAPYPEAVALAAWKRTSTERAGKRTSDDGRPFIGFDNESYLHQPEPSLLVIDTDGKQEVSVIEQLAAAVPGIENYAHLTMSSTGANLYADEREIKGLTGQHTVFVAADGTDIPRALNDLFKRLVLAGHFQIQVTPDGKALVRNAIDRQLRIPSQPVFLHAHLGEGLDQRKSITFNQGIEVLDTRELIKPLSDDEVQQYAIQVAEAKRAALPEMAEARRSYIQRAVEETLAARPEMSEVAAQATVAQAMSGSTLYKDFLITLSDGEQVTVGEILDNPERYNEQTCRDPLEPKYGSSTVAKIYLDQDIPVIHSFAHHGRNFKLINTPLGAKFDLTQWFEDCAQVDAEAIEAEQGDVDLARWLQTESVSGKNKVPIIGGEATADDVALSMLRCQLGIEQAAVLDVGDARADDKTYPGIGLCYRLEEQAVHLQLSITAIEALINSWLDHDRDTCIEGWAALVAEHSTITDENEPAAEVIVTFVRTKLKLPSKKAKEMLSDAISEQSTRLTALYRRSKPRSPVEDVHIPDPAEVEAERQRKQIKHEADLLQTCKYIAEQPLEAFYSVMKQLGVAGERDTTLFAYLIILSAHLYKPSNALIRGPSGSGKSFTMKAAARLFPEEWIYVLSSMSAKALIYEPRDFRHTTILLEEAESLVRTSAEDKNEVAEMLRVLLSEGQLIHRVVGKDETGNMVTMTKIVEGPTNLITSTTRAKLDEEITTRMVDRWSDTTPDHMQDVLLTIAQIAEGEIDQSIDIEGWHAFADWIRCGPRLVVVPFASIIADQFSLAGARVYRDLNNLLSLIKASALMHRLNREVDDRGRIVATVDDYKVAYSLVGERIDELAGERVPVKTLELFKKIEALIKERGTGMTGNEIDISQRDLAKRLGIGKNSIAKELSRLESNGLLDVTKPVFGGRHAKLTISVPPEAEQVIAGEGRALITPDELEAELTIF